MSDSTTLRRRDILKLGIVTFLSSLLGGSMDSIPVPSPLLNPPASPDGEDINPNPAIAYTFQDEFDGPAGAVPASHWVYDLGGGGWGNSELETYTNTRTNSYLDGQGHLVIAATKDASGNYYSARLKTLGTFSQQGGHFEARIKLDSQPGVWPAFWMLGADFPSAGWPECGEVDILEDYGQSYIQTTVHTPDGTTTYSKLASVQSDANWHTYRLDWDLASATFVFSRDGTPYLTVSSIELPASSWVFGPQQPNNGGMFFLLNVAVGGYVGTPPATTQFPVTMLVDYVRAWQ